MDEVSAAEYQALAAKLEVSIAEREVLVAKNRVMESAIAAIQAFTALEKTIIWELARLEETGLLSEEELEALSSELNKYVDEFPPQSRKARLR